MSLFKVNDPFTLTFFSGHTFLSKNNEKHQNSENNKIYQLEIMHILMYMIQ